MEDLTKALKYFLSGVLLHPVLINVIGFMSPFLLMYASAIETIERPVNFLSIFQLILPFFSIFYLLGAYYLSKLTGIFGKIVLLLSATMLILSYTLKILTPSIDYRVIAFLNLSIYIFLPSALYIAYQYCHSNTEVYDALSTSS